MTRTRLLVAIAMATIVTLIPTEASFASAASTPDDTAGVTGEVYAVAQVGDRTIIGGDFTAVGGVPRRNAAAIRADGTVDPTFDPSPDGVVQAVEGTPDGSRVFIGGDFTTVGGANRSNLAAVDGVTGAAVATWDAGTNDTVFSLAVSGDRLYAGGRFTTIGAQTRRRLAAVDLHTGTVQLGFNPFPDWTVKEVLVSPDGARVYAVGGFTAIGGAERKSGAAEVLASTGGATAFDPVEGGVALAAGLTPNGERFFFATTNNRLFAYDPATSNQPAWQIQTSGDTQAIVASATEVYFGGHFGRISTHRVRRSRIASVHVADGSPTDWNPGADGHMGVWATALSSTHLLVGGDFENIGGRVEPGFARFALTPGADVTAPSRPTNVASPAQTETSFDLTWDPSVDDVVVSHYTVYVDGSAVATSAQTSTTIGGLSAGTAYSVEVDAVDAAGNRSARSPAVLVTTQAAPGGEPEQVVPAGATWRFLDDGSDQATAWRAPGFADSGWAQGPAEIGFGDGDEATVVTAGHLTYYLRHGFAVTGAADADALAVHLNADDGAAVYLNGVELVRDNLPEGTLTADTYASTGRWGAEENVWREFTVPATALVEGANVLAVEVHQDYRGSGDLSFDLRLDVTRS